MRMGSCLSCEGEEDHFPSVEAEPLLPSPQPDEVVFREVERDVLRASAVRVTAEPGSYEGFWSLSVSGTSRTVDRIRACCASDVVGGSRRAVLLDVEVLRDSRENLSALAAASLVPRVQVIAVEAAKLRSVELHDPIGEPAFWF